MTLREQPDADPVVLVSFGFVFALIFTAAFAGLRSVPLAAAGIVIVCGDPLGRGGGLAALSMGRRRSGGQRSSTALNG
jgi:hypothetical protein